ncbi:MAG: hypothetical protein LKCHEGNO_03596 [Burkholderiaceae bacterium]|nr:hypothetical protein [Burkholderiaceae bacterium]
MNAVTFTWSHGANRYDVTPAQHGGTLREFARFVARHRAPSKARAGYICAPLGNEGHRKAANALQRAWLALDVDDIDPAAFVEWRLHLTRWRGFGWPTARSSPEAPRERVVIELSDEVSRDDGVRIGDLLQRDVAENFGVAVRLDPCQFRAEQPAFLPLADAVPFYLLGDPLDVPTWLAQAPPAPPPPPPLDEAAAELADVRMRCLLGRLQALRLLRAPLHNHEGYALHCPWVALHTSESGVTATAVLYPSEANGWRGGFSCLHSHCRGRRLRDLLALVSAVETTEAEHVD